MASKAPWGWSVLTFRSPGLSQPLQLLVELHIQPVTGARTGMLGYGHRRHSLLLDGEDLLALHHLIAQMMVIEPTAEAFGLAADHITRR